MDSNYSCVWKLTAWAPINLLAKDEVVPESNLGWVAKDYLHMMQEHSRQCSQLQMVISWFDPNPTYGNCGEMSELV